MSNPRMVASGVAKKTMLSVRTARFRRVPRHIGIIPDGNRRWATSRGLARGAGYSFGIPPGLCAFEACRELGIPELSVYGFTKENVKRSRPEVEAFRSACVRMATALVGAGAGLLVVGDSGSRAFPSELNRWTSRRSRGAPRANLLVNYSWRWDLRCAIGATGAVNRNVSALGSSSISRIDLVIRWGGRQRLSGFLPMQSAYADMFTLDTLWPDMRSEDLAAALDWYQVQDVTLGG